MKKTFNYNLKSKFKTSVLLSVLSVGVLIGNVSCRDDNKVPQIQDTEEANIKIQDSLFQNITECIVLLNKNNNIQDFDNIIYNVLNDSTIDDRYGLVYNLQSLIARSKSVIDHDHPSDRIKKQLLNNCEIYLDFMDDLTKVKFSRTKKANEEFIRNKMYQKSRLFE